MNHKIIALSFPYNFTSWHTVHDALESAIGEDRFDATIEKPDESWDFNPTLRHYLGTEWQKHPICDHIANKLSQVKFI